MSFALADRTRLAAATLCVIGLGAITSAPAAATEITVRPLAIVGADTLTTTDLKVELGIMVNQKPDLGSTMLPEPAQVLRRLVQNELLLQEGYRMGLQDEFVVSNQVDEFVRSRAMGALLDSVAIAVPAETPDLHEARRQAVENYLRGLNTQYDVTVDSTLLASLDYGSADPQVQQRLREDQSVLAVVPRGQLTVAGFSRILRFTEFHGLVGKPNAADRRDKVFREWLAEAVLNHQIDRQNILERPTFVTIARRLERSLVLQETLQNLLRLDAEPTDAEIETFYRANLAEFTPPKRVKMASLKVGGREDARTLWEKMSSGTPVGWLKNNFAPVVAGPAPFPDEFFTPEKLGLSPDQVELGFVPEPYQVPSGWVVAKIVEIDDPEPTPLAAIRGEVRSALRARQTQDLMTDIVSRLEDYTPVTILPDAESTVGTVIDEFFATYGADETAAPRTPGQEG